MTDEEIVGKLASAGAQHGALALAELLTELTDDGLTQATLISYFKRAFPEIPLRTLLDAGGWSRLTDGGLSDAAFESTLSNWLPRRLKAEGD